MSGNYFLNIYCEAEFDLDGDVKVLLLLSLLLLILMLIMTLLQVLGTEEPMILGKGLPTEKDIGMTKQQFYEKKEQLRERLIADYKRLGITSLSSSSSSSSSLSSTNTTTTTTINIITNNYYHRYQRKDPKINLHWY